MSTDKNPEYAVGDETSVAGTVVRIENIGGNYQYTVAVQTEGNNRPVSTPAQHYVAPEEEDKQEEKEEEPKDEKVAPPKPVAKPVPSQHTKLATK